MKKFRAFILAVAVGTLAASGAAVIAAHVIRIALATHPATMGSISISM
jgi:hypothetical protein